MVQKTAITEVIKSLADVETRFNLRRTEDEQFFTEVEIVLDDDDDEVETLRGRIDVSVLQNRFWVTLLESKRTAISAMSALPQTLTYMMANPHPDKPAFGMVTNGDGIIFVKLSQQGTPQYDISRVF